MADTPATRRSPGVRVHPVRGVRYSAAHVPDLGAVTAPPYDVIEPAELARLEADEPHNIVRLTLPRGEGNARYDHAAATLNEWLHDGILVGDRHPSLYVYEQSGAGTRQRGLLGSVELDAELNDGAGSILPHENVYLPVVEDRRLLMDRTAAQVEPILLLHARAMDTAAIIDRAADTIPLVEITIHGVTHTVWSITSQVDVARIQNELSAGSALIADGHHRFAAYRSMAAKASVEHPGGTRQRGLALLVDRDLYPPDLHAIHRTLPALAFSDALDAVTSMQAFRVRHGVDASITELLLELESSAAVCAVVGANGDAALLDQPDGALLHRSLPDDTPPMWRTQPSAIADHVLAGAVWGRDPHLLEVHHQPDAAVAAARVTGGVAVLIAAPRLDDVVRLAEAGVLMPRKSTSFAPKPRSGLVLRTFAADSRHADSSD